MEIQEQEKVITEVQNTQVKQTEKFVLKFPAKLEEFVNQFYSKEQDHSLWNAIGNCLSSFLIPTEKGEWDPIVAQKYWELGAKYIDATSDDPYQIFLKFCKYLFNVPGFIGFKSSGEVGNVLKAIAGKYCVRISEAQGLVVSYVVKDNNEYKLFHKIFEFSNGVYKLDNEKSSEFPPLVTAFVQKKSGDCPIPAYGLRQKFCSISACNSIPETPPNANRRAAINFYNQCPEDFAYDHTPNIIVESPQLFLGSYLSVNKETLESMHTVIAIHGHDDYPLNEERALCMDKRVTLHEILFEDGDGQLKEVKQIILKSLDLLSSELDSGHSVLIHCRGGRNRSAIIVWAYLCLRKGYSAEEAFRYIVSKRLIGPAITNIEALLELISEL